MIIIIWAIAKNNQNFIGHIKFWITNTMCCGSTLTSIIAMISNFLMILIFCKLFYDFFFFFFFIKCNIPLHLDVILAIFLLALFGHFSKSVIIFACSFKVSQKFFMQFSPRYKLHWCPNCWHWISKIQCLHKLYMEIYLISCID